MIPTSLTLPEIQSAFRDYESKLNRLLLGDIDLQKRRIVGAGNSVSAFDYVTRFELDETQTILKEQISGLTEKSETLLSIPKLTKIGPILFASAFPGGDLGAKINAALASLGTPADDHPGEVWIDESAGTTITTPVVGGYNQVLRFLAGRYTISAKVSAAHIIGVGQGDDNAVVRLTQGNGINLPRMFEIIAYRGTVQDVYIDGNKANNATGTVGVYSIFRILLNRTRVRNCSSHGAHIVAGGIAYAGGITANTFTSYDNGGDGICIDGGAYGAYDFMSTGYSEYGANGGYGIHLINAAGARINASDIAANAEAGIFSTGTGGAGFGSGLMMISGCQFGQNFKEDILISGYNAGSYTSYASVITGNSFWGGANRAAGVYSAIKLADSKENVVIGNVIFSVAGTGYKNGVEETNAAGFAGANVIGPNHYSTDFTGVHENLIAGAGSAQHASDGITGKSKYNTLAVVNLGVTGADVFIGGEDGAANVTQIVDAAGATIGGVTCSRMAVAKSSVGYLFGVSDAGDFGIAGHVGVGGDLRWLSGTSAYGIMTHANTTTRFYDWPDEDLSMMGKSVAALTASRILLGAGTSQVKILGSLGTTTTVLHGNAGGDPSFGAVDLAADVSGTLPVANGGTGVTFDHIAATLALTACTTTAGPTVIYSAGSQLRFSYTLLVTTADAISAATLQVALGYVDDIGSTSQSGATLVVTSTARQTGSFIIQRASGDIAYAVVVTGAIGSAVYAFYATLERLT